MKIKYKDITTKNAIKHLGCANFPDLEWLMFEFAKKYYLENPTVLGIESIDYDFLGITLSDLKASGRIIKIIFNPFSTDIDNNQVKQYEDKLVTIQINGDGYSDVFLVNKNTISICKSVYKTENNQKLEKFYTIGKRKRALMNIKNTNYFVYRYHFKNNYLNTLLILKLKITFLFQEAVFIQHLLNQKEEIKDITMLYSIIQQLISPSDMIIEITNQTPLHQEELLDVENGYLKRYKHYKIEDEVSKKYDYHEGELIVTTKEKIQNSPELNKVIKLVKGVR